MLKSDQVKQSVFKGILTNKQLNPSKVHLKMWKLKVVLKIQKTIG